MNDKEALAQINWAMDEYLKDDGSSSETLAMARMALAMARIAQTLGRNSHWHRVSA